MLSTISAHSLDMEALYSDIFKKQNHVPAAVHIVRLRFVKMMDSDENGHHGL